MEKFSCRKEALPLIVMIIVELAEQCSVTLSKAAMTNGLSRYVFVVYYDTLGTLILLPWFIYRCLSGKTLPITSSLICRFFCLGLLGKCLLPTCFYAGLSYSSITLGAAIGNLTPIITFLFALLFRMEKLDLRKLIDQIKVMGTIIAVLGALIVTLYKGPALQGTQISSNFASHTLLFQQSNWPLACLLFIGGFAFKSLCIILQADTAKSYPDEVAIVFFITLFGTIQTGAVSLFMVKSQSEWLHLHKIDTIAIFYASSCVLVHIIFTWCLRKKGAIYVSMFPPLKIVLAVIMGFVFLQDGIYLGSIIGSITIVAGFYSVMWAQAKKEIDMVKSNIVGGLDSASTQVTPLLQNLHI